MVEAFGKRLARLRNQQGWTQQALAERLALSRVAVSHFEAGLSLPSERTVALLAGLFKLSPTALVEGSSYPRAKVERLPSVVCWYTEVEFKLGLLQRDLKWLALLNDTPLAKTIRQQTYETWMEQLALLRSQAGDSREAKLLERAYLLVNGLHTNDGVD